MTTITITIVNEETIIVSDGTAEAHILGKCLDFTIKELIDCLYDED